MGAFRWGPFGVSDSDPCSEIHTLGINYIIAVVGVVTDYVALRCIVYYVSSLLWTCVPGSNGGFLHLLLHLYILEYINLDFKTCDASYILTAILGS